MNINDFLTLLSKESSDNVADPNQVQKLFDDWVVKNQYLMPAGSWHKLKEFTFEKGHHRITLTTNGLSTGCGIMQMYGAAWLQLHIVRDKKFKETFEEFLTLLKKDGVGCIIATLGQSFYRSSESSLLELGFQQISQYNNWRHGANYTQKLYALTIK